jgi:hypothetical protein
VSIAFMCPDKPEPGGDPSRIIRHEPSQTTWKLPDSSDSSLEEIEEHIARHVGLPTTVAHEILSHIVHIDIHIVEPTKEQPFWTLVTSGMSDLPMTVPEGAEEYRYAELMLRLPAAWDLPRTYEVVGPGSESTASSWPIDWLRYLARFPHEYGTWLGWGHSVPNGDPPEPLDPSVAFEGCLLLSPVTVPNEFLQLKVREEKVINFYAAVPVYRKEMDLKLRKGTEVIEDRFDQNTITEIVDVKRLNVAKFRFF